jgi:hypothetical protein
MLKSLGRACLWYPLVSARRYTVPTMMKHLPRKEVVYDYLGLVADTKPRSPLRKTPAFAGPRFGNAAFSSH